ncbi:hypothetical protein Csa_018612 [Cucumis sativus]|nr:hypothetical protein Csa_018612 [Cucumis sativus]
MGAYTAAAGSNFNGFNTAAIETYILILGTDLSEPDQYHSNYFKLNKHKTPSTASRNDLILRIRKE